MSYYELFKEGHQTRNKAHFASIASIAMSDGKISDDAKELVLITKYAIGLGYNATIANDLIQNSIDIYTGNISFDEYKYLINNRLKK